LSKDGSPYVTPVWAEMVDDLILINTFESSAKKNSWYIHRWSGTSSNYGNVTGKSAHKKYNKRDQAKQGKSYDDR